jgi:hypothetical protein
MNLPCFEFYCRNPPEEEVAGKRKGGIQIPEYWPWEEAKKIFEKPDVLPANEVEVAPFHIGYSINTER